MMHNVWWMYLVQQGIAEIKLSRKKPTNEILSALLIYFFNFASDEQEYYNVSCFLGSI